MPDPIADGESGFSARTKINEAFTDLAGGVGSNANGRFVELPNGYIRGWRTVTLNLNTSAIQVFSYPRTLQFGTQAGGIVGVFSESAAKAQAYYDGLVLGYAKDSSSWWVRVNGTTASDTITIYLAVEGLAA